jgi:tetratricopeptide (TPR) repeat protein
LGAYAQGNLERAREYFIEAQDIFIEINDKRNLAITWVNLARTAYRQGDYECAWHFLEESLSISRELKIRWTVGYVLEIMGLLQRKDGNYDRALSLFMESLQMSVEQANQQGIANCLGALAGLAVVAQQPGLATRLFAAADKIRQAIGAKMGHDDQLEYESYLIKLRDQLENKAFEEAWSVGQLLSSEQTMEILKDWVAHPSFPANPQDLTS